MFFFASLYGLSKFIGGSSSAKAKVENHAYMLPGIPEKEQQYTINHRPLKELVENDPVLKEYIIAGRDPSIAILKEVHQFFRLIAVKNNYWTNPNQTNNKKDPNKIYPNETLLIPPTDQIYTIKPKDTLWRITTNQYAHLIATVKRLIDEGASQEELRPYRITAGLKRLIDSLIPDDGQNPGNN